MDADELYQLKHLPDSPIHESGDIFPFNTAGNIKLRNKYTVLEEKVKDSSLCLKKLKIFCIVMTIIIIIMAAGFGYFTYRLITMLNLTEDKLGKLKFRLDSTYHSSLKNNTMDIQENLYSVTDISARLQILNETVRRLEEKSPKSHGELTAQIQRLNGSFQNQFDEELRIQIKSLNASVQSQFEKTELYVESLHQKADWLIDSFLSITETSTEAYEKMTDSVKSLTGAGDNISVKESFIIFNDMVLSQVAQSDDLTRAVGDITATSRGADFTTLRNTAESTSSSFARKPRSVQESTETAGHETTATTVKETTLTTVEETTEYRVQRKADTTLQQTTGTTVRETTETASTKSGENSSIVVDQNFTTDPTATETTSEIPVNENWTKWSPWSECSATCGSGQATRTRSCDNPNPGFGSLNCTGSSIEQRFCKALSCPRNGRWTDWSVWSQCSVSCGSGQVTRTRSCSNPSTANCTGPTFEHRSCRTISCPIHGGWSLWGNWSPCSKTCGYGIRQKERSCNNPPPSLLGHTCFGDTTEYEHCYTRACPVDGDWSQWSTWSSCSASCGNGMTSRYRACNSPRPADGGLNCIGSSTERTSCLVTACLDIINGGWSTWGDWSICGRTCGQGIMRRNRTCTNPHPSLLGADCQGESSEYGLCNMKDCPVDGDWSQWSTWSSCSASCGNGMTSRYRACNSPRPANGGLNCIGPTTEHTSCLVTACHDIVNGEWSTWGDWSICSSTCGKGIMRRNRTCTNPQPSLLGADCQGESSKYGLCNIKECPVNGQWSEWSVWSGCSASCGNGTATRLRTCSHPVPTNGGLNCVGSRLEEKICAIGTCFDIVHGGWTLWSRWSTCSSTCGQSIRRRTRSCSNPGPSPIGADCQGDASEYELCHVDPCPVNGQWSEWSVWSGCSASCGNGTATRLRMCSYPVPTNGGLNCVGSRLEEKICAVGTCFDIVHGGWTLWSRWSTCSSTCGQSIRRRVRSCSNPEPSPIGDACQGDTSEYELCHVDPCPVDGHWSVWSVWSGCSVSCGKGEVTRLRSCSSPLPSYGGLNCTDVDKETKTCDAIGCPVHGAWSLWSSWTTCSSSCGNGIRRKTRSCSNPAPSAPGNHCPGSSIEYESCFLKHCPVNGDWSPWSVWSSCSVTCASGEMRRTRTCSNPSPVGDGLACIGSSSEQSTCRRIPCPVDGNWGSWSSWSNCDASCGVGTSHRRRSCTNPRPSGTGSFCLGDPVEYKSCQGPKAEGDVRLSNGASEGRVEICYKGEWGTICDDGWSNSDAKVVCKMVGRSGGSAYSGAHYGQGSGPILLDDVGCTGDEGSILQCNHRGLGSHNCGHSEDAGVKCS